MSFERFSRPVYDKEAERGSTSPSAATEQTDEISDWMTAGAIMTRAPIGHTTVRSIAEKYRQDHPDWFAIKKSRGIEYEHYAPALVKLIIQEASSRIPPEGWKTINTVGKEVGRNGVTVAKIAAAYRAEHPEWFKKYTAANGRLEEHLSPALARVVSEKAAELVNAPEGWMNVTALRKKLDIDFQTVMRIAQEHLDTNPDLAREYRGPTGVVGKYFSPELIQEVEKGAERYRKPPEGWKTASKIGKDMRKDWGTIQKLVEKMGEAAGGREYYSNAGLTKYYPPETIKMIENAFSNYEEAPDGWMTRKALQRVLNVSKPTTIKLIKQFTGQMPEGVKTFYNPRGQLAIYVSNDFADFVKERMASTPIDTATIPTGWRNKTDIASEGRATKEAVQELVEIFLQTHSADEHIKKIDTKRDGPKPHYYSPELSAYIHRELSKINQPPSPGWKPTKDVLRDLSTTPKTLRRETDPYRTSDPTYFHLYSEAGITREYYSPELIEIVHTKLRDRRELAPDNWMTPDALQKTLDIDKQLIQDFANGYRASRPQWFREFRTSGNSMTEHYSPRLAALIRDALLKIGDVPAGWITNGGLAKELDVSIRTTSKIAERYRQSNPDFFSVYKRPTMKAHEYYAPRLVDIIRAELTAREKAPEGWFTQTELSKNLNSYAASIQRIADQYRDSNTEWFVEYASPDNRVYTYFSPTLVALITQEVERQRERKFISDQTKEREEKLNQDVEDLVKEVAEGQTPASEELQKLFTLFRFSPAVDILFKYRPDFQGVSPDYAKGVMAKYLGDFLILNTSFKLKDLEVALPHLSESTFRDSLFEVIKEDCLREYHEQKLAQPETDDRTIIDGYLLKIKKEIGRFDNKELNEIVNQVYNYYLSILEDFEKPEKIVDALKPGRPFPDLNQVLNIKEIQEKKKMLIGDEMGMGKSASAIFAKEYLGSKCAVVVVPSNVIGTWQQYLSDKVDDNGKQLGYFKAGMAPRVLTLENPMFLKALDTSQYDYVLLSQEKLNKRYVTELKEIDYDMLIVDEVHKLKNIQEGERAKFALELAEEIGDDKHLVLLSGTPVPNKIKDVAITLRLLYPERFSEEKVKDDELVDSIIRGEIVDMRNLLVPRMQMKSLRESIKMPNLKEETLVTQLSDDEREMYEVFLDDDELTADEKIRAFRKFVMNPSSLGVTPTIEGSKLQDVRDHVRNVFREKDKVVFFVNSYVDGMIRGENTILSQLHLPNDVTVRVIDGSVSKEERAEIQRELREYQGKMLLAVSGATADVGVDFSAAEHIMMYNDPWTKFDKSQEIARVYRPGLEHDLTVTTSVAEGTIEEGIEDYIEIKYNAIQKLLKGVPITKTEQDILRTAEKQKSPDIEGNVQIAREFLASPANRLHKFYGATKGRGEKHFRKFLLEHGDEYADSYFDMGSRGFQANNARVVGSLINKFIAEKKQGSDLTILDIASGPEMLKSHIGDAQKDSVVSLDLNPRFFEAPGSNRVVGSMVTLPFKDKSADYANMSLALHYAEFNLRNREYEQLKVLAEMNRVLKPGGRGMISLIHSQQFKDPEKFDKVIEGAGFRTVPEYTGIASSPPHFQSYCLVLEKVRDVQTDIDQLVKVIGRENLDGFKVKSAPSALKNTRRIVNEFELNGQKIPIAFNAADNEKYAEERAILREGEALKREYGSIRNIPHQEVIQRNFLRWVVDDKKYRLLKKSEKIGGFVDVR